MFAQKNNSIDKELFNETKTSKKNVITFYPLSLLNVNEPTFQVGYERSLSEKWVLKFMGGIIPEFDVSNVLENLFGEDKSFSGFKFNTETKYIFYTSKSKKSNFYISSDIFFTRVNSFESTSYYFFGTKFEENAEINQDIYGANVRIGRQFTFNRFLLEFYGGVGLGKHFEDSYNKKLEYDDSMNPYYVITENSKDYYKINFPINVILGFRF